MFLDITICTKVGEKISIKNKTLILSFILIFFFTLGAISASDLNESCLETQDADVGDAEDAGETLEVDGESETQDAQNQNLLQSTSQPPVSENGTQEITTSLESDDTTIVKGKYFSVCLKDDNGSGIANKTVTFKVNNVLYNIDTDDNGVAKLKIDLDAGKKYNVYYSFSEDGYTKSSSKTTIFVISSSTSKIKASNYVAYVGIKNRYTVTLTAGSTPLDGRTVKFTLNGKSYNVKTNSKGQASLNINLKKGSYTLKYSYAGEKNIKKTSGSVKITVKRGAPTSIKKANSVVYYNKVSGAFKIKLVDAKGNPVKNARVIFKISGKKYIKKTNADGIATLSIKKATGTYKLGVLFAKNSIYNKAYKAFTVKVKSRKVQNNGMWLFGSDMKSVNLKTLKNYGFKHIFLNYYALELYGKSGVEKWIKSAKNYGIKVHIWMQVFNNGNWINPVKNGKIDYDLINSRVNLAKSFAKISGVSGVHFDYVRYPGTAYKYSNSVNAVNTFIKQATTAIHGINKNLIVSAAVMPEPSAMKSAYGQDISTMGKYLDAIVPMVYKGNYGAGTSWIKSVTQTFNKQSSHAQIWTGLQAYKSDSNVKKLSASELKKDASSAVSGGATGVILFRYGLTNIINLSSL